MTDPEEVRKQEQQEQPGDPNRIEARDRQSGKPSALRKRPALSFDELQEVTPRQQSDGRLLVMRPEDFEHFCNQLVNSVDALLQNGNRTTNEEVAELGRQAMEELAAIRADLESVLEKLRAGDDGKRNEDLERFRFDWMQNELKQIRELLQETPRKRHYGPRWKFW